MRKSKIVGILGGMGPYATVSFYQMLLELTPAAKDWDHLRVIIDVNPHIPSRSRHHLFGEASPVAGMIDSCRRLEAYPVDFIVVPCNSASHFLPQVRAAVKVPILNIMQITSDALPGMFPGVRRVAVIGAVVTYDNRTYEPYLKQHGIEYIHHPARIQRQVEQLIELIKINAPKEQAVAKFQSIVHAVHNECGVGAVILGCTEFGCLGSVATEVPVLDSGRELARAALRMAME